MAWKAIDYEEKYFDQMVEMVRENYGDVEIADKEFLKWQYFDNPAGKAIINFAYDEENNELAGQYVIVPMEVKLDNSTVKLANSLDTLTRKEHRGQGIFKELARANYAKCMMDGLPSILLFPNKNSRPGFIKYFNPLSICRFPILVYPIGPFRNRRISSDIVAIIPKNISLLDGFWEYIKDAYPIMGVRNMQYMKWRYLDSPSRKYGFYGILKNGALQGYITGIVKPISGLKTGVITDMLISKDCDKADVKEMVSRLIADFSSEGAKISMAFFPEHSTEYKVLRANRYFKWPQKFEPRLFEVLGLDFEGQTMLADSGGFQKEKWFTTIGDYLLV